MKRKLIVLICVLVLVSGVLFAQSGLGGHLSIIYVFTQVLSGKTEGTAIIDAGDGKPTTQKYDSFTRMLDEYVGKGWTPITIAPFVVGNAGATLLVFEKK